MTSASTSTLSAVVPSTATTGPISVTTYTGQSVSTGYFFVPPVTYTVSSLAVTGSIQIGGPPVNVTLDTVGTEALFAFNGTAGQQVSINVTNSTLCCSSPNWIYIIQPGGNTSNAIGALGFDDSGIIPSVTLPTTGTYTVFVVPAYVAYFGYGSTGSLTLQLSSTPTIAVNGLSIGGSAVTTPVNLPGQDYSAAFSGTAGQQISLNVTADTLGTANFYIIPPGGTVSNAIGTGTISASAGFIANVALPTTGTYSVLVVPESSSTGNVTLQLFSTPTIVVSGLSIGGSAVTTPVNLPGQDYSSAFNGTAGQQISLSISNSTGCNEYYVIPPSGNVSNALASTSVCAPQESGFISVTLPTNGSYTIFIEPYVWFYAYTNDLVSVTGSMTLQLFQDQTGTLSLNGPAFAASTLLGQVADLSFSGTAGQQVSLSVSDSTYGIDWLVVSNVGEFLFPLEANDSGAFSLPSNGTYFVQLGGGAAGSADVTLYDATPATGNITVNGSAASLNTNPGQPLELSFSGTAGEQLLVGTSSSTYGSVSYTVFEPDGYSLASGWLTGASGSDSIPPLPSNGTYTLELIGDPGAGSASVQLSSTTAQNLTTTFGGALTVTLNGEPINITFTGNAGQWVEMTESNSTLSACVSAELIDPEGGIIWSPFGYCLATPSGFYYMDAQELPNVWYLYDGLRPTEWSDWQRRDTTLQCDADDRTHHSKRFARDGLDDRAIAELHVHVYWHADRTSRCRTLRISTTPSVTKPSACMSQTGICSIKKLLPTTTRRSITAMEPQR